MVCTEGTLLETDDHSLIQHIAAGSEQAMNQFFQRHHQSVYTFALRRLNEPADAADVLNDVMLQVWRGADRFAGQSKVTTWLLGIANHKIMDIYRKRKRHDHEELDHACEDQHSTNEGFDISLAQDAAMVKHCMDRLSDAHREVVHLTFFEDMSYPDIAEVVGCPPGTVKTRMMHAKKNLKRCLQAQQAA
jgi:RNA polymerase sigma-70 factor (ECF subfamily)